MFDKITAITDIIIALIGLFFVVKDAKHSKKIKKKELIEEVNCMELAKQASDIRIVISKIRNSQNILANSLEFPNSENEFTAYMTDELKDVIRVMNEDCKEVYADCESAETKVREVYENLLKNESMFSLSIGFERIINVCRQLVYELEPLRCEMNDIFVDFHNETKRIGFYQVGNYTATDLVILEEMAKKMNKTLSEICHLLENAYQYIRELEIKFTKE